MNLRKLAGEKNSKKDSPIMVHPAVHDIIGEDGFGIFGCVINEAERKGLKALEKSALLATILPQVTPTIPTSLWNAISQTLSQYGGEAYAKKEVDWLKDLMKTEIKKVSKFLPYAIC